MRQLRPELTFASAEYGTRPLKKKRDEFSREGDEVRGGDPMRANR